MYQLKAKDSEIKLYPLCLANISKDFTLNDMTKAGLKGSIINFFLFIIMLLILATF